MATLVERAQRGPLGGGGFLEPAVHHGRHGDPLREGMVLEEVTLSRLGGLGVFSNGPRQCIVERGARFFPRGGCGCHGEEALTFLPCLHGVAVTERKP